MEDEKGNPAGQDGPKGTADLPPEGAYLIIGGTKSVPLSVVPLKVGRSHDNSIVIDDPRISRHHIEIRAINGHHVLFDLGSSGGTFVNGQRTSQAILYPGDIISLAGVEVHFVREVPQRARGHTTGLFPGLGERQTAIFKPSMFNRWKK